jgi:hypothetical protein
MKITTNYKKAVDLSKKVIGILESKVYPFNRLDSLFPDAIIPKGVKKGSVEHALYLFYSIPLDSGRESTSVYKRARKLYEMIRFSDIPNLSPEDIKWAIHNYFEAPKIGNEEGKLWADPVKTFISNGEMLDENYQMTRER